MLLGLSSFNLINISGVRTVPGHPKCMTQIHTWWADEILQTYIQLKRLKGTYNLLERAKTAN